MSLKKKFELFLFILKNQRLIVDFKLKRVPTLYTRYEDYYKVICLSPYPLKVKIKSVKEDYPWEDIYLA